MNENADVGHFKPYCYVIALVSFYVPIKKKKAKDLDSSTSPAFLLIKNY